MRVLSIFVTLLAAHCSAGSLAVDTTSTSTDLTSEFLAWKASSAGQAAYENGFVPTSSSMAIASTAPTAEELMRFENAKATILHLQKEQPRAKFSLQTPFALLTTEEFAAHVKKHGVRKLKAQQLINQVNRTATISEGLTKLYNLNVQAPAPDAMDVDWQQKGCVSSVKDQGQCGVCWAFAALAAIESGHCIQTNELLNLSVQDVISCRSGTGTGTCNLGWSSLVYDYMLKLNGGSICTEESYPYESRYGWAPDCRRFNEPGFTCKKPELGLAFYEGREYPDHTALEAVVTRQPVSTQLHAGNMYFQFYSGGVFMGSEQQCPAAAIDHELLIVGYGTRDGVPVWKVKNQWGQDWGEEGYGYLERGFQGNMFGTCGIESYAYTPIFNNPRSNLRCLAPRYGIELQGTTLKMIKVSNSDKCCETCRIEEGCVGYIWRFGTSSCELKSLITGEKVDLSGQFPPLSSTIVTKQQSANQCTPVEDNVEYPGNEMSHQSAATAAECCDLCNSNDFCNAYTWSKFNGGLCSLKSKKPATVVVSSPLPDGTPYFKSGLSFKCQALLKDTDIVGHDIENFPAKSFVDCCGICRNRYPCETFVWSDANGGTCWLKTFGGVLVSAPGVIAGSINVKLV